MILGRVNDLYNQKHAVYRQEVEAVTCNYSDPRSNFCSFMRNANREARSTPARSQSIGRAFPKLRNREQQHGRSSLHQLFAE